MMTRPPARLATISSSCATARRGARERLAPRNKDSTVGKRQFRCIETRYAQTSILFGCGQSTFAETREPRWQADFLVGAMQVPVKYRVETTSREWIMGLRKLKSVKHNGKNLEQILEAHEIFYRGKDGGARADLTGADLSRADLRGVNFAGAILRNANMEECDLRGARLPGADLSGSRLRKADLRNTDMTEAVLPGADLTEAQASGVEFFRCDMRNVNFQKALLRNANFRDAQIAGAKFSGADMGITILRETDLSQADLSGVDLSTTLMPPGYATKKQGAA